MRVVRGAAIRRNFPGMRRGCARCGGEITVTEQMCKRRKYVCGPCLSAAAVDYARRNPEKKRTSNNAWQAKNSANRADKTKRYRQRYPEKRRAHQAVQTAIRNGTLTPKPCVECGATKAHAHHDDYKKPLAVIWLCHKHHMERHALLAARKEAG